MEFVRYVGTAHRRLITSTDFRAAGIRDQETVEWSYRNNFSVPVDQFSDDVLEKVIKPDPHLVIVGGEGTEPRNLGQRQTPAQAAGPRIDMNTAVRPDNPPTGLSERSAQPSGGPRPIRDNPQA